MKVSFPFNKNALTKLEPESKRYEVCDENIKGLRLTVFPTGGKTFILLRKVNNRAQRIKIGRFPEISIEQARNEAKRLISLITLGGDPHEYKKAQRQEITFKELFDIYYKHHLLKFTKRPDDNKNLVEFDILPAIGSKKASKVTKEHIRNIHTQIGTGRSKSTANRVINIVGAAYNFAEKEGYYSGLNPCRGLKKYKFVSRDRFLNHEELESFFNALKLEEQIFADLFKILLYTGARKSNVLSMRYKDLNLVLRRWRISETETKNKDVNIVALSYEALKIITYREAFNEFHKHPSQFVFPGDGNGGFLKDPKRSFNRIKKRMTVSDLKIHDLRRTLGSYMAINGASLSIIGETLNHKSLRSTAIYARLSQDVVVGAVNNATLFMNKNTSNIFNANHT